MKIKSSNQYVKRIRLLVADNSGGGYQVSDSYCSSCSDWGNLEWRDEGEIDGMKFKGDEFHYSGKSPMNWDSYTGFPRY